MDDLETTRKWKLLRCDLIDCHTTMDELRAKCYSLMYQVLWITTICWCSMLATLVNWIDVYVAIWITTVNVASSVFSIPTFKRVYYKCIFLVYRLSKYYDQNKLLNWKIDIIFTRKSSSISMHSSSKSGNKSRCIYRWIKMKLLMQDQLNMLINILLSLESVDLPE